MSHSGNPEFSNPLNRPIVGKTDVAHFLSLYQKKNQLEMYLNNLKEGIVNNGTMEWQPSRKISNPRISLKSQKAEYFGHLPEQMEKKKEMLIKFRIENEILKSKGLDIKKYPSQVLRELEEKAAA
jgi:hypothetical protein